MPRRKIHRLVDSEPPISVFKPAGVPARDLEETLVTVDEFEALRLSDYEGLNQREACDAMKVSQPTFNRILISARKKVSTALVKGYVLRIDGGNYVLGDGSGGLECRVCGHVLEASSEESAPCPKCGSTELRWTRRHR